jgi:hypothetical protein
VNEGSEPTVNVTFRAEGAAPLLSNLAHTPFLFRGIQVASAEGFIQGLKEENPVRQARIFQQFGYEAQRASSKRRNARVQESGCVWFNGAAFPFPSEEYFALIEEAIREKFRRIPRRWRRWSPRVERASSMTRGRRREGVRRSPRTGS